jgi:hypothetical protein
MARVRIRSVERAVRADLAELAAGAVPGQATLTEMALRLARVIDGWPSVAGSAASLSALTKAHQELRMTLGRLLEVSSDDGDDFDARMSTPVRDAAKS